MDRKTDQGFALIGVLVALAIMGALLWVVMKAYFKPASVDPAARDAGVDTSSYKSIIDSARQITQDAANTKPRDIRDFR